MRHEPPEGLAGFAAHRSPSGLVAQDLTGPTHAPDVHFVPTNMEVVKAMLTTAKVGKGDVVYDLGCGDGRIPITAIKKYGARSGVCVDLNRVRKPVVTCGAHCINLLPEVLNNDSTSEGNRQRRN